MKMKTLVIGLLSWLLFGQLDAQVDCQSISLGEVYEKLKHIDVAKMEPLTYRKYSSFNFKNFKPIENAKISEFIFFEIGYNSKNQIREIIHHEKKDSLTSYRMLVFDYPNSRILTLGTLFEETGYGYFSAVFVMDKASGFNYMINTEPVFGDVMILESVGGITYKGLNELSLIMILDKDLFPTDLFRISEGRIVFLSEVKYRNGREIEYEQARIFFPKSQDENLKISADICPSNLKSKLLGQSEDMCFKLYPSDERRTKFAPLWIQLGFPNYR